MSQETVRKIADRIESVRVKLTPQEIEDRRRLVMAKLQAKDKLKAELKAVKSDYKSRNDRIDQEIEMARAEESTGEASTEVAVSDFLTRGNEVVTVRSDTGEPIGRRTATQKELQEDLDLEDGFGGGA